MSSLRKPFVLILMAMMTLPAVAVPIEGDGMTMTHSTVYDKWGLVAERTQFGLISYKHGIEHLIIAIKVGGSDFLYQDEFAWMFPVPGDPSEVEIGIVNTIPQFDGEELGEKTKRALAEGLLVVSSSQIYPLMVSLPAFFLSPSQSYQGTLSPQHKGINGSDSVDVFKEVSMYGVTTELISTGDSDALASYFMDQGLQLPPTVEPILGEYIGENYSFVLSRISDIDAFRSNASLAVGYNLYSLGVMISFPTDELYYPMKLTSSYGSATVPVLLQVMGYVSVEKDIGYDFELKRFSGGSQLVYGEMASFFGVEPQSNGWAEISDQKFTEIKIETEAASYTSDIWMTTDQPVQAEFAEFVIANNWLMALIIFVTASMASSLLAALWIFHGRGPMKAKFAVLGLSNFLTLIGFILISAKLKVHETLVLQKDEKPDSRPLTSFVSAFSVIFILMVFASYATIVMVAH